MAFRRPRPARARHRPASVSGRLPHGGGAGMVMRPEPLFAAIEPLRNDGATIGPHGPGRRSLSDALARELAREAHLALVCGRYEGVDERARSLAGPRGEHRRLRPHRRGAACSRPHRYCRSPPARGHPGGIARGRLIRNGLLEHPQYTRPEAFRGMEVPAILRSGSHGEVERWRHREALRRTLERRPDLLDVASLSDADRAIVDELGRKEADPDAVLPVVRARCYSPPVAAAVRGRVRVSHHHCRRRPRQRGHLR